MWWKIAKLGMSQESFNERCKQSIRTNPFFKTLFKTYGIDIKDSWPLEFIVKKLKNSHAISTGDTIIIDENIASRLGFNEILFAIVHELVHWLTRQKEKTNYFSDPEEKEAFNWSIAHELSAGKSWDLIEEKFLPLILLHIKDINKAKNFMLQRFRDARKLLRR